VNSGAGTCKEVPMRNLLLSLVLLSACGDAVDDGLTRSSEIQGGALDKRDPAVGLVWLRGGGFCSGTLIAPDVVLTAGHCVEEPVAAFYTGEGVGASDVGARPAGGLVKHTVSDQLAHPSYRSLDACPNPTFDVGLLRLASPITTIKPVPVAEQPPITGTACRTVGYGVHDNRNGTVTVEQKRSATEIVENVDKSSIEIQRKSGIVDHGDSGGPLLCKGAIAGTTSCGDDQHQQAFYARVDELGAWIGQAVAAWR
jgi:hypothetical protein